MEKCLKTFNFASNRLLLFCWDLIVLQIKYHFSLMSFKQLVAKKNDMFPVWF